jgi:hypothetical protein
MAISGINNDSIFNLSSIRSLAGNSNSTSRSGGGSFTLGGSGGLDTEGVARGGTNIGDVNSSDGTVDQALNSVAAENALQQQFKNQLALVNLQERVQTQSRTVEILTNILKSRHDASLSAARNLK